MNPDFIHSNSRACAVFLEESRWLGIKHQHLMPGSVRCLSAIDLPGTQGARDTIVLGSLGRLRLMCDAQSAWHIKDFWQNRNYFC